MISEQKPRWWEDYLVRYLTPMLVGSMLVAYVGLLLGYPGGFKAFINSGILWADKKEINISILLGILISGFTFAYICSTPITVFHAGRMIHKGLNGYATPFWYTWFGITILCATTLMINSAFNLGCTTISKNATTIGLVVASLPAFWMFFGQCDVIRRIKIDKEKPRESEFVQYYDDLATSRNISPWSRELRESYTHLREHANSVFICLAEISVAALIVLIWRITGEGSIFVLICLLGLLLWIAPNVFLWSVANRLEKRLIKDVDKLKKPSSIILSSNTR